MLPTLSRISPAWTLLSSKSPGRAGMTPPWWFALSYAPGGRSPLQLRMRYLLDVESVNTYRKNVLYRFIVHRLFFLFFRNCERFFRPARRGSFASSEYPFLPRFFGLNLRCQRGPRDGISQYKPCASLIFGTLHQEYEYLEGNP